MKILFLDHGLNLELALLLGRAGHTVLYHVSPVDKHSLHDVHLMGRGFKEITKVDSWVGLTDTVDMICSPDCHLGEVVDWAQNKHIPTWGSGSTATRLELDRWYAAQQERNASLPSVRTEHIVGVPRLIELLANPKTPTCYVKCSGFREIETFKHEDWTATQEQFIAPLLQAYGADKELEFVLTQPIDPAKEVGADNILLNGEVGSITPYGYEDKDVGYIGVLNKTLPPPLQKINDALLPHFKSYSTFFSTEARVVPNGQGYPIDLTVRAAHPVEAGMLVSVYNLANVVAHGSQPYTTQHYVAVLVGESAWAEEHPVEIKFPNRLRNYVKFAKAQNRNGRIFTVPSHSYPVQVVGTGSTAQAAATMCKLAAQQVEGKDLGFDLSSMDKLVDETVPEGRKYGIDF